MSEGINVVTLTAPTFAKDHEDVTIRKRLTMAVLREEGRIRTGATGFDYTLNLKVRQRQLRSLGSGSRVEFVEHTADEQLTFDVRGYYKSDLMPDKDRCMNEGPQAIVNRYATIIPELLEEMDQGLNAEFYADGVADTTRFLGIESFMGTTGPVVAADRIVQPSATYAGKSTALRTFGGTWTSNLTTYPNANLAKDWPDGHGSSEYDANSPKILNTTSTTWTGNATWKANGPTVLSQASTWCNILNGDNKGLFCHIFSGDMWQDLREHYRAKGIMLEPHPKALELGFPEVFNFEGTMMKHDFDVAPRTGYGLNFSALEMFSNKPELIFTQGPQWDMREQGYLFLAGIYGNLKFLPKFFAKYAPYA